MEMQGQPQQVQPVIRSTPYQNPMNNFGSSIIMMTNPYDELHDMELSLRGMIEDKDGIPKQVGDALMNEQGISEIMGMTRSIVNKITIMGNLDKREIAMWSDYSSDTLAKTLMMKRLAFGIKSEDRDMVFFKVIATIYMCMKRPFNEGDRRFWKGSQQEITTRIEGANQNKGIMSKIVGWGR